MERLKELTELIQMTREAQRLVPISDELERLKTLLTDIRRKAQQNYEQERGARRRFRIVDPTRFELCMLGIREELTLGRATFRDVPAVEARLRRVSEDIERVRKELAAQRRLQ